MKKWFRALRFAPAEKEALLSRILLSALSVFVCTVVLCSATLAYFTDEVSSSGNTLTAAHYTVEVTDPQGGDSAAAYVCAAAALDEHTFTLTAGGTATVGHCRIDVTDPDGGNTTTYYTDAMTSGQTITLTVKAVPNSTITFTPCWGAPQSVSTFSIDPEAGMTLYGDGSVIHHSATPCASCTITEGLTLDAIAEHYGVSAESILAYNGITALPEVGQTILIPNTTVTDQPAAPEPPVDEPEDEQNEENGDNGSNDDAANGSQGDGEGDPEVPDDPDGTDDPETPVTPDGTDDPETPVTPDGTDETTTSGEQPTDPAEPGNVIETTDPVIEPTDPENTSETEA